MTDTEFIPKRMRMTLEERRAEIDASLGRWEGRKSRPNRRKQPQQRKLKPLKGAPGLDPEYIRLRDAREARKGRVH